MNSARSVDDVISRHMAELSKPGVISVRPGYQAAGGWLTKSPAIVVNVERKQDDPPAGETLPEKIEGYPVDVRQASPLHRLRSKNVALFASVASAVRPELERPVFPFERDISGQPVEVSAAAVEALRAPSKPQIPYAGPAGARLKAVQDRMTITCHASPDAGWTTLGPFLKGITKSLTVGMYDLTSAHVLAGLLAGLKGSRKLNMVLDHPAPNPTRDQTDEQSLSSMEAALGQRLNFAWALERQDPKTASWIFPNAYHIKVAVRDGTSMWLSSGNWNNSNQPDIDPLTNPRGSNAVAAKSDRDWHVIVEHTGLSALYEKYLLNDLKIASANQVDAAALAAAMAALGELAQPELELAAQAPKKYFAPKKITDKITIQPLLTPDNYFDQVLPLINSAKKSFYMQTQYIHPSDKPADKKLAGLVRALAEKIRQGLDVRLIMSQYETLDYLELLQDAQIDLSHVRVQNGVHNKGIVVDSETVMVSSQNWSGDGVDRNRDAGVIIYHPDAAKYWEEIFIHDWTNLAHQRALD